VDEEELAALNAQLVEALAESGQGLVSCTRLHGRFAIRLCVLNHTTRADDVERVVRWLERAERPPAPDHAVAAVTEFSDPAADVIGVRLERDRVDPATLAALPLFESLERPLLERLAASARIATAAGGEAIVRKWEMSRDFYVLIEGTAAVTSETEHLRDLARGDFFGELGALAWGANFSYSRLATVTATSPVSALVISSDALAALMHEAPSVAAQVNRALRDRLPRV
jgi:hypothetical protein